MRASITTYSPRTKMIECRPFTMKSTAVATPRSHPHRRRRSNPQPIASSNVTGTIAFQNRGSNLSRESHAVSKTKAQPSNKIAAA